MLRVFLVCLLVAASSGASAGGIVPLSQSRRITTNADAMIFDGCPNGPQPWEPLDLHDEDTLAASDFGPFAGSVSSGAGGSGVGARAYSQMSSTAIGPHFFQVEGWIDAYGSSYDANCGWASSGTHSLFDINFRVYEEGVFRLTYYSPEDFDVFRPEPNAAILKNSAGEVLFNSSNAEFVYGASLSDTYWLESLELLLSPGDYQLKGGITGTGDDERDDVLIERYRVTMEHIVPEPSTLAMLFGAAACCLLRRVRIAGELPDIARHGAFEHVDQQRLHRQQASLARL